VKPIVAWFAANPVAANLLMTLFLMIGITSVSRIPQKTFPDIDIDIVSVGVEYLGAAPEEVEEGVCVRIEEQIEGVEGIDKIQSTSNEGACGVLAEVTTGADVERVYNDVKNRVDAIATFPQETEKPIVSRVTIRRPVVDVAISGDADERSLRAIAQQVRDEIAAMPGITQVDLVLTRPFEISVEVAEETLRRHAVTFDDVTQAVRRSSLDLPGGSIKSEGGEILLRAKGQAYRGPDFEDIVVLTRHDGTRVTLGEIATIVDGFEDTDVSARFDQQPVVIVQIFRVGEQDVLAISDAVKRYVAESQGRMPEGVRLTIWQDDSNSLRGRLDTLLRNGRNGFLLVLVVLTLFLQPRLAFWVTLGVPIAIVGALGVFIPLGLSIDVISLFAFIVVLGILVDDAIVVGENVHTHEPDSSDRLQAAIVGTQEVTVPVIFGVLTTVATFSPMLMVPGPMGQVFGIMATVVIACLLFSLIESQLVLPAHLAHGKAGPESTASHGLVRTWNRVQQAFSNGLLRFAHEIYRPFVEFAQQWRYSTIAAAIALLLATAGLLASGRMPLSFFPPIEADYLAARLTMPQGTPAEVTRAAVDHIEAAVEKLRARLDPEYAQPGSSLVRHVLSTVGTQPFKNRQNQGPQGAGRDSAEGAHLGEVVLELLRSEDRKISTSEVAQHWREIVGSVPDAVELLFASDLFSAGEAIDLQLQGPDVDDLREAAQRIKAELAQYPGVIDIADSFRAGKQEVKLSIRPTAELLGLKLEDLARQVRQAFYGEEAQRIQRGRDDIRVMVRYPAHQRRSLGDLEGVRVRAPDGTEVPFGTVARADLGRGFSSIRRADRQRVVNVTADVDRTTTTANEVLDDLIKNRLPSILADYPRITYGLEGEQREQRRAFGGLVGAYALALFAVYALLAVPLRSYTQPLIIMSVIPFGIVGAIFGHLLLGRGLSFMSVIGIVALSGVVVNASLVLVHYINQRRSEGISLHDAVTEAGVARFRPIVLTSLTTFAGLTPLILERSVQAQFLIPMAVSLGFGVLFATVITLVVVPAGYLVLEDIQRVARGWLRSSQSTVSHSRPTVRPASRAA
jgi:multidrug efflux pump subunit AcrB